MNKKIMGAFAILIIALSIVGIVYAHWTDSVQIHGTAQMGSITFGFTSIIAEWDSEDYLNYPAEKRTATAICDLKQPVTDAHTLQTAYKLLEFNITGGYPEYWGINKFTLDNKGTIPVKIQSITLTVPKGLDYVETIPNLVWDVYNATTGDYYYYIWLYNETAAVDTYRATHPFAPPWVINNAGYPMERINGTQIDKLGSVPVEMCVVIPETAQICHTYTFSMEIEAIQWNKYTP
jgi:hypothetical protein